uniref:Trafficking regulator of GLUT4 (SLC2A4) 1/pseudo n=1 Tax=Ursus americanus TaxID=9643 RepID=A0A452REK0_URSAM
MANPVQPQFPSAQEPGTALPLDLREMEKLLTMGEGEDDKAPKLSKSLSGALDLEQNGHGLPFKVASEGHQEATLPWSASRASSRRASSIATASSAQDQEVPKDYLILAIASCFCPVWPLNLIPLIFSIMVSCGQPGVSGLRVLGRGASCPHPSPQATWLFQWPLPTLVSKSRCSFPAMRRGPWGLAPPRLLLRGGGCFRWASGPWSSD